MSKLETSEEHYTWLDSVMAVGERRTALNSVECRAFEVVGG
jgi:hypothetical protein